MRAALENDTLLIFLSLRFGAPFWILLHVVLVTFSISVRQGTSAFPHEGTTKFFVLKIELLASHDYSVSSSPSFVIRNTF